LLANQLIFGYFWKRKSKAPV